MKRLVFILLILVFLFPTLLTTAGANDEIKAPDFTATDENGAEFSLHDLPRKSNHPAFHWSRKSSLYRMS